MNKMRVTLAAILMGSTLLTGCAGGLTGETYSRNDARKVQQVRYGVVESATPVVIEGSRDGIVGTGAGAIVGGIAGSSVGGGRGSQIATVLGAVAGGALGNKAQEAATRAQGQEITVVMDNGQVLSVVQEVEQGQFLRPGDRIRLLQRAGQSRIVLR